MLLAKDPFKAFRRSFRQAFGNLVHTADWWVNPRPKPSFLQSYERQRRLYATALERNGRSWGELWPWETKTGVRALAHEIGVDVPALYQGCLAVSDLDFSLYPDEFVLKPVRGYARNGVFVLRREGDYFVDLLRDSSPMSTDDIRHELTDLGKRGLISANQLIVEQALLDEGCLPYDWKVYAFRGETPLVVQISRGGDGSKYCYYDKHWNRLEALRRGRPSARLPRPKLPAAILRVAESVSKNVPVPFARIDVYEVGSRVYLGEVTPMPGGGTLRFSRALDTQLGQAWEDAEAELIGSCQGVIGGASIAAG